MPARVKSLLVSDCTTADLFSMLARTLNDSSHNLIPSRKTLDDGWIYFDRQHSRKNYFLFYISKAFVYFLPEYFSENPSASIHMLLFLCVWSVKNHSLPTEFICTCTHEASQGSYQLYPVLWSVCTWMPRVYIKGWAPWIVSHSACETPLFKHTHTNTDTLLHQSKCLQTTMVAGRWWATRTLRKSWRPWVSLTHSPPKNRCMSQE